MRRSFAIAAGISLACLLVFLTPVRAGDDHRISTLAEDVAELRADLDARERAVRREQTRRDSEIAALQTELEQLRLQADRAESRASALEKVVTERRSAWSARHSQDESLRKPMIDACRILEDGVRQSSPLRRPERLERIKELRSSLQGRDIEPVEGLRKLESIIGDEFELSRTTQLTKHVTSPDGKERLVPVVAVGTALMYWEPVDGVAGRIA
jgi:predicted RNase H-like nuclease (RuvC/YqgF family)